MEVGVLGPVAARLDAHTVDLGTPKQRALVAALALFGGRPVAVDTLVDLLWGDDPPAGVTGTLQAYVSGLRRALEPQRQRRAPASVLVTVAPGYALRLEGGTLDAAEFERTVQEQHRRLQVLNIPGRPMLCGQDLADAVARLDTALGLWRGTPYAELDDAPAAVAERARLEELRLVALEDHAVAELALGHHSTVAATLEALTAAYPLRERLWGLRALALTRSGRQAEALDVLREVRQVLDEELGLEPGAELRELQTAVLRQDPSLDWVAPPERSAAPVVVSGPPVPAPGPTPGVPWPMLGREEDLAALVEALDRADAGTPSYAVLTGDPGIGKTRLASELSALAVARGARVAVGRCSRDDGAPPLWPWAQVLRGLGAKLPDDEHDDGAQFGAFEQIVRTVRDAARDRLLVVGIDDLHWADSSSLRVLGLLAETALDERLLVLATWRDRPEPSGPLGDVAEALARRHAVRRELRGLGPAAVAEVFATVAHNRPSDEQADALCERTDGNPFFVVEYARLAGERTDLGRLLAEEHPPSGVQEVLSRRLARLPDETVSTLRTAAVIGRWFDAPTLARAAGLDEDDLLDVIEPAEAAGLVRDVGVDRFGFAHALVRDTLLSGLSATRRARIHLRVAAALDDLPDRRTEQARHWLAAGPAYAAQAWRATVEAAGLARRRYAHEETAELLREALRVMADDPTATRRDRYDVLMHLIDAYRWSAMWPELTATVEEAVEVAEGLGDTELVARAAISTTQGALWQSAAHGQVHESIVTALRGCLEALPPDDGALRCRVMLGLANELYYGAPVEDRQRLVADALAMARRLDDDELLLDACQIGFVALWRPATAGRRLALAEEALVLAERLGKERAVVVSACLRAVVYGELGQPAEMWAAVDVARGEAQRLRIPYGLMVLDSLVLPWLAMQGRFDECEEVIERIRRLDAQISLEQSEDATAGAAIALAMWQGGSAEVAAVLEAMEGGPFPISAMVISFLWRGGEEERARAYYAAHPVDLAGDDWFSLMNWCMAAEVALHMGDAELGAAVYDVLAPYAGMCCCAGSSNASGPVEAFLACAAEATGRREVATEHAEAAAEACVRWEIPLAARWLDEQRARYGF